MPNVASANASPPPAFGLDMDGDGKFSTISPGATVSLNEAVWARRADYPDVRIAYEIHAQVLGYDPATIKPGSVADNAVLDALGKTLDRIAIERQAQPGGTASNLTAMRREAERTASNVEPITARLDLAISSAAANAPGAALAHSALPATEIVVRGGQASGVSRTPVAQAGLAGGAILALALGELAGSDTENAVQGTAPENGDDPENESIKAPFDGMSEKGERRKDDSCAPEGTTGAWVIRDRSSVGGMKNGEFIEAYQQQIARTPDLPGHLMVEYEVTDQFTGRSVDFDGCAYWSPSRELLEAKAANSSMYEAAAASNSDTFKQNVAADIRDQARRQFGVVGGLHPVEYHVAYQEMMTIVERGVVSGTGGSANFGVQHTPAINSTNSENR